MMPERKLEEQKIKSIAKGILANFDKAGLGKFHQKKIISKATELLNL